MIDLAIFCRGDNQATHRYDIGTPFIEDGYEIATNGFCIIRIRTQKQGGGNRNVPRVAKFFKGEYPAIEMNCEIDIKHSVGNCPRCKGEGDISEDCLQCAGSGQCECECGDEHICGRCDGGGKESDERVKCPACDGSGELHVWDNVEIGGYEYAGKFLSLCKDNLPAFTPVGIREGTMKFTFDGGEGVLMNTLT